jgi:uncharacterized protein
MIDTSVFCGHWPFRRLPAHAPDELKTMLAAAGVTQAWVAPLEGVFFYDPMDANEELSSEIRGSDFFIQCAVINPSLPTFHRDTLAALDDLHCRAIKIFPNYHGYAVKDPRVRELAAIAEEANIPVCIQMRVQDERAHHPLVKVGGVSAEEIVEIAKACPKTRFLACAPYLGELKALAPAENLWAELSFVENGESLRTALSSFPHTRLVFGSHSPLHYFAAGAAKLNAEMALAAAEQIRAIATTNAEQLLGAG